MRLWRKDKSFKGCKFLVQRRDGSVPKWPYFVLGGRDPAAPTALRASANHAESLGMDPQYVGDLRELADEFDRYREANGPGDPDGKPHRADDPRIIELMEQANNG